MAQDIDRLVELRKQKQIVAAVDGRRYILFEGEDFPDGGITKLTETKIQKRLDELIAK